MKKFLLFSLCLSSLGFINAQSLGINLKENVMAFNSSHSSSQNYFGNNINSVKKYNELNSSENIINSNEKGLFRKGIMSQGALKVGTMLGTSKPFISGAEITLFDSDIIDSTVPFIKSTQVPFVGLGGEYMLTDKFGVGGFGAFTISETSNRDSKGVNKETKIRGLVLGAEAYSYRQVLNWLYLNPGVEFIYGRGNLEANDGLKSDKYEYQDIKVGLAAGVSFVFSEDIQVQVNGGGFYYNTIEFVQKNRKDINGGDTSIEDQVIKKNAIRLEVAPRLRILIKVFKVGGGNSNK